MNVNMNIMKYISIILFTLTAMVSSSPSYAEWKKVSELSNGTIIYVDFERIRKQGNYSYHWELAELPKSDEEIKSYLLYVQVDCSIRKYKQLSFAVYTQSMAKGPSKGTSTPSDEWNFAPPNSVAEMVLEEVCNH